MKQFFTLVLGIALSNQVAQGQTLFTNGPIQTGATSKSGATAPTGTQWSEAQNDMGNTMVANTNAGISANFSGGSEIGEDFVVPAGQRWTVNSFSFFGYQTGASPATSPITALNVRVWDGQPGRAASQVIFGDATTNRLSGATDAMTYRIFNSLYPNMSNAPGTTRKVWQVTATITPALVLSPGTYWVSWASTAAGAHFYVPVTVVNARTVPTANAVQRTGAMAGVGGTWGSVTDAGTGTGATPVNLDIAFRVQGSSMPLATRTGQPGPNGLSLYASHQPAAGTLLAQIANLNDKGQLLLSDAAGRLVWQAPVASGATEAQVPVQALAAGTYLLELRTAAGTVRERVLKH